MSLRPHDVHPDPTMNGLAATRHRVRSLVRWLTVPGAGASPDCVWIRYWHRPPPERPVTDPDVTPVLLVHGYAGTEHRWHPLRTALAETGFEHVIAVRYNVFRADIHQVADWLVAQVDRTMDACEADGVHLIGHSLGGLIVRDAVQSRGLGGRARTVVTVATPHHGSPFARLVPGPCARQMHPGSEFLRSLAAHRPAGATRWIDISGDADRVVAGGPAPAGATAVRIRQHGGHCGITRHRDVVTRIVEELAGARRDRAGQFSLAA